MFIANINIILATTEMGVIGKDNDLPWHLPEDLKRFKEITSGSPVIMGRKCWESIPDKFRPLPNRTNVVLTRNKDYKADGAEVRHNLSLAIEEQMYGIKDVFIIGGSQIYKEAFPLANRVYMTTIYNKIEGDTYLEGFNWSDWKVISTEPMSENGIDYQFLVLERRCSDDKHVTYNFGNPMHYDDNGDWEYVDGKPNTTEVYQELTCPKCGLKPTIDGHDPCIANLPDVDYACCGHGNDLMKLGYQEAYIGHSNGKIVRFNSTKDMLSYVKENNLNNGNISTNNGKVEG